MWVTALVGMMTKFSEVLLSVHFREKTPPATGGRRHVLHQERLGPKWVWLGTCFAVFGICACIGTGGMVQAKAITDNISGTFGCHVAVRPDPGGPVRGRAAGRRAPHRRRGGQDRAFMAIMYVFMCLLIIGMNIERSPPCSGG